MNSVRRLIVSSVGAEQRVADVGDHHRLVVERRSSRANSRAIVIGASGSSTNGLGWADARRESAASAASVAAVGQLADEVVEPHVVVVVMPDPQLLARGVDALGRVEIGREDAEVDVGHEAPSISRQSLSSTNCVTSPVPIAPSYTPTNSGCFSGITLLPSIVVAIGICELLGQGEQFVLQAEAVDLDVGHDHRPLRLDQQRRGFVDRLASASGSLGGWL